MNALITNTATLNAGDAAILFATAGILHHALGSDLHVTACDLQAGAAARAYPDLDVHPTVFGALQESAGRDGSTKAIFVRALVAAYLWHTPLGARVARSLPPAVRGALERIAAARVVVSAGGTYLVPHYRILPKLADLLVAYAMGRPYVLFTQSLGPFSRGRGTRLLGFVLRRARLILVRDARSRYYLDGLRVRPERIIECADAAFALPLPRTGCGEGLPGKNRGPLQVAISVRDWPHMRASNGMRAYLESVAALTADLVARLGAEVTFVSTCQGASDYWTDDSTAAAAVVERLDPWLRHAVRIDRDFHTPWQLMSVLGRFDAVVATRMHVAILALLMGVPVLPIAYEFKTSELFGKLGLGGLVQDIEAVTPAGLCAAFDHFLAVRSDLSAIIPGLVARERRSAFAAGEHVKEVLAVAS
jgi:colanic acid/amylovoran biosynthesis protein